MGSFKHELDSGKDIRVIILKSGEKMANKSCKFRIYPTQEQKLQFAKTFGCARFIYNKMLEDKITYYQKTKKKLNNTPAQYKDAFPFLKDVDSMALCNAQMNLQNAYNNFFYPSKQWISEI